jgi:hypothetical protein
MKLALSCPIRSKKIATKARGKTNLSLLFLLENMHVAKKL